METLTSLQQFELVLIPFCFLFSQILILIFGLNFLGNETWVMMGIPVLLGSIISFIFGYFLNHKKLIQEFKQLEKLFRILVLAGGGALIPLLIAQNFHFMNVFLIFFILSLIFSTLGGTMTISCILLVWHFRLIQKPSE
ncbi:MAG: hypothetical protein JSW11_12515 [Candidatus Heimdallarchaeota archaeon]|nr:MAG: hypothetical protein JSW11_12515 [Candidatus Heimdallarchaeota archaeon]